MSYTSRTKDNPGDVGRAADQQASVDNDTYLYGRGAYVQLEVFSWSDSDVVSTDDGAAFLPAIPFDGLSLIDAHAAVRSAGAGTSDILEIQIHNVTGAVDMLSTKLSVDNGETDSSTAATPVAISTDGSEVIDQYDNLRIDIDVVPETTAPQGLIVTLRFG